MECVEDNVGVSNKISSFVLPLGATVNMNGTALYECAAAMFLAQAYGLDLTLGVQFSIVFIALLTSVGVAGVPSASLVAIAIILGAVGLPVEAIGVLLVFDRVLDMAARYGPHRREYLRRFMLRRHCGQAGRRENESRH
jgi:Na+/H+-dicarboxylate symporter